MCGWDETLIITHNITYYALEPTLNIIGNVPSATSILILNGENDTQTPVQEAFLLQQRLTEVDHPDHTLGILWRRLL
jgi:uncharacterized protein